MSTKSLTTINSKAEVSLLNLHPLGPMQNAYSFP